MNPDFSVTHVIDFLSLGINLLGDLRRHSFSSDARFADVLVCRAEEYVSGLVVLLHVYDWSEEICGGFASVIAAVQGYISHFNERFDNFVQKNEECYHCPYEEQGGSCVGAGRPRFFIPREQLQGLRSLHFSWKKIAEMLGVSEKTVRRRRHELDMAIGYQNCYSNIPDDELDVFIRRILDLSPQSGERMVLGSLRAQGIKVQRNRVREAIGRVDPISRDMRRRTAINRRVYNVPTPNALWYVLFIYIPKIRTPKAYLLKIYPPPPIFCKLTPHCK